MYYVYAIQNKLDLRVYIGQTVNPKRRWGDHKWLSKNKPEQYIHQAMIKHGVENFIFQVIDQTEDGYQIDNLETDWINWFKSRNKEFGYNIAFGGNITWKPGMPSYMYPMYGKHHSEETKKKLSDMFKGRKLPFDMTEDIRKKMSESKVGHIVSEKTCEKISQSHIGILLPDDHKDKISKSHIGLLVSQDTKSKMSAASKGKPKSEEHRKKISEVKMGDKNSMFGKKQSDKTKLKISKSLLKLTSDQVLIIRERLKSGSKGIAAQLAKEFGVSITTIYGIRDGKQYAHV